MEFKVIKPGMLTTVQDLGRWGYQSSGVPVAGAMDLPALRMGNAIVGNAENAAALEVTFLGPELAVVGEGLVAFAGADLGFSVNGKEIGSWAAVRVKDGDVLSFGGLTARLIHTPGHTPGGWCLYFEDESLLIAGDTC